ncbi:hypothetical protein VPH35_135566 [Triticum aestivum]
MSDLFSGIQAAMVINRVENSEQSPEDWNSDCDGSGGSSGLPGTPCFTSRLSLLKVGSVIGQFSDFKRQLIKETGFDGMLELKSWQKISLKYSAYLMDRVDVDSSIINLEGQVIEGEGVEPSEACIEYTRVAASFSERGMHSLKAAEAYLNRAITESSTQIEKDCFKIAFVIFVVDSYDHLFWLMGFVSQLFVLDSLDLGVLNMLRGVTPRIGLYNYDAMKKMVEKITVNVGAGEVSFHGATVPPQVLK